mgnify:CR=1 FL=1
MFALIIELLADKAPVDNEALPAVTHLKELEVKMQDLHGLTGANIECIVASDLGRGAPPTSNLLACGMHACAANSPSSPPHARRRSVGLQSGGTRRRWPKDLRARCSGASAERTMRAGSAAR